MVDTQTGLEGSVVVASGSTYPLPRSQSGEPNYPASEAVEFENPAYDTIGPDLDDHFKGYNAPKQPLAVAELVQPSP